MIIPAVEDVRKARRKIAMQCDYNTKKLLDFYKNTKIIPAFESGQKTTKHK